MQKALNSFILNTWPHRLFQPTILRLFSPIVAPVAAYGMSFIWGDLTVEKFDPLNRTKTLFLKGALGLHHAFNLSLVL